MFVITLRFTDRKAAAPQFLTAHNEWLRQGFDDGVFVLAGGLQPKLGGALLAVGGSSLEALQARVGADPFVSEGIVTPEILEISPFRADERLALLAGQPS